MLTYTLRCLSLHSTQSFLYAFTLTFFLFTLSQETQIKFLPFFSSLAIQFHFTINVIRIHFVLLHSVSHSTCTEHFFSCVHQRNLICIPSTFSARHPPRTPSMNIPSKFIHLRVSSGLAEFPSSALSHIPPPPPYRFFHTVHLHSFPMPHASHTIHLTYTTHFLLERSDYLSDSFLPSVIQHSTTDFTSTLFYTHSTMIYNFFLLSTLTNWFLATSKFSTSFSFRYFPHHAHLLNHPPASFTHINPTILVISQSISTCKGIIIHAPLHSKSQSFSQDKQTFRLYNYFLLFYQHIPETFPPFLSVRPVLLYLLPTHITHHYHFFFPPSPLTYRSKNMLY